MAVPPPLPPSGDAPPPIPGMAPPPVPSGPPPVPLLGEGGAIPVKAKSPPAGKKFPCRECGAKLDFDPEARGLKCPYCGFTEVIPLVDGDQKAEQIQEHDLEEFLAHQEDRADVKIEGRSSQVQCTGCGAIVLLEDKVVTDKCPYCNNHLDNQPEEVHNLIAPESVLPFAVSDRQAREVFNKWISSLWFAPSELKNLANLGQFVSVYEPYWTYDSMTYTRYTGQRGDDYWDTEYYNDSNGNRQSRQVKRTNWYPVSGEVQHFFDDVLIKASKTLPVKLQDRIAPWDLQELEPFRDEYLSGHKAGRYSVSLNEGFDGAKKVMDDHITTLIRQDIGGDHQSIDWRQTQHAAVTFKHTLLPMWVANYRYHEKLYQILVNGRSAKVSGDRPWSTMKIVRLIILVILAIVLTVVLVGQLRGNRIPKPKGKTSQTIGKILASNGDRGNFLPIPGVGSQC